MLLIDCFAETSAFESTTDTICECANRDDLIKKAYVIFSFLLVVKNKSLSKWGLITIISVKYGPYLSDMYVLGLFLCLICINYLLSSVSATTVCMQMITRF